MPNGHLDVGAGIGEAAIWNPNQIVQSFTTLMARQQTKRQQEQQQLASELTQVKTDGLRNEADRKVFFDKYSGIKDMAAKIPYEKDNWKKAQLKAQIDQGLLELKDYAVRSKRQGANEADWSKAYMAKPEVWGDDALKAAQMSKQAALTDKNVIGDFTTLQRRPDIDKINKDLSLAMQSNLKAQPWETIQKKGKEGNKTGVTVLNQRAVNPEQALATAGMYYDDHPDMQRAMQLTYPDVYANNDPKTAKAMALSHFVNQGIENQSFGPTSESKPRDFKADWKPDNWKEKALWHQAHPAASTAKPEEPTYFQDLSERMRTGVPGSGEELRSVFENNPSYLKPLDYEFLDNGKIKIKVPAKYKTDSKNGVDGVPNSDRVIEEHPHTFTVDKNNPAEWTNTMAQIYRLGTGESVNPTKASTTSGKGKVKGGLSPVGKSNQQPIQPIKLSKGSLNDL